MAQQLQWFDRTQPQTLQNAVMLAYVDAALFVVYFLFGLSGVGLVLLLNLALAPAGLGIASQRKWGYWLGVVTSGVLLLLSLLVLVLAPSFGAILNLLFIGVLATLLLHPLSRSYQKVWFR